jgi:hypothetical protein
MRQMELACMQVGYAGGSGSSALMPLEDFFHKEIYQTLWYHHIERLAPVRGDVRGGAVSLRWLR